MNEYLILVLLLLVLQSMCACEHTCARMTSWLKRAVPFKTIIATTAPHGFPWNPWISMDPKKRTYILSPYGQCGTAEKCEISLKNDGSWKMSDIMMNDHWFVKYIERGEEQSMMLKKYHWRMMGHGKCQKSWWMIIDL